MQDQELIVLRGLPGSGKTTWARRYCEQNLDAKRVNRDDIRSMLDDSHYTPATEYVVLRLRDALIAQLLILGYSVVVDDTNLTRFHVQSLQNLANPLRVRVRTLEIETDIAECIARDARRPKPVGADRIREMQALWEDVTL